MNADSSWATAATVIGAAILAWIITGAVRRHAVAFGLIDAPNARSSHAVPTPRGGGVGFVIAGLLVAAGLVVRDRDSGDIRAIALLSVVAAATGLLDDIRPITPTLKLLVHVALCTALAMTADATLSVQALMVFAGVWWINLFNFMDGIDGIAAAEALFMLTMAAALTAWTDPILAESGYLVWMIAVAAALIGFLPHNWPPARIFMGDVGSTWLGFLIFALALATVRRGSLNYLTWLILGATFIADATLTLLRRMATGQRWFEAHRSHAYQRLARRWESHRIVTLLGIFVNLIWIGPLAILSVAYPMWSFWCTAVAYAPLIVGAVALGAGTLRPTPVPSVDRSE